MEREMREQLKELSRKLLGASSRYQKMLKKPQFREVVEPNGKKVKKSYYLTEEQVLEVLLQMESNKKEQEKLAEVQKAAGSVGN